MKASSNLVSVLSVLMVSALPNAVGFAPVRVVPGAKAAAAPSELNMVSTAPKWEKESVPCVYQTTYDMLDAALLMYPMTELRMLARDRRQRRKIARREDLLKDKIKSRDVEEILNLNKDFLQDQVGNSEVLMQAVNAIADRQRLVAKNECRNSSATLVKFSDQYDYDEIVYAIGVDDANKRIVLSFRGSNTTQDWIQDLSFFMNDIMNPLSDLSGEDATLRIHSGFQRYLRVSRQYNLVDEIIKEARKLQKKGVFQYLEDRILNKKQRRPKDKNVDKYQEIMDDLEEVLENYSDDYELYVTGHSLGAALASLFSFYAAAENNKVTRPVNCVSIASPYVGGPNFRKAFKYLEEQGRLRYLRVANQHDMVTVLPFFAPNFGLYKHVGVQLKLLPDNKGHSLMYPEENNFKNWWDRTISNSVLTNLANKTQIMNNHSPKEYSTRLETAKETLRKIDFRDLYEHVRGTP